WRCDRTPRDRRSRVPVRAPARPQPLQLPIARTFLPPAFRGAAHDRRANPWSPLGIPRSALGKTRKSRASPWQGCLDGTVRAGALSLTAGAAGRPSRRGKGVRMDFGIFTEQIRRGSSQGQWFQELLDLADAGEHWGLDVVWLAEMLVNPARS